METKTNEINKTNKFTCPYCGQVYETYPGETDRFETYECPYCGADVYFDLEED